MHSIKFKPINECLLSEKGYLLFNFTDCIFHLMSQVKRLQVVTEMYLFAVPIHRPL